MVNRRRGIPSFCFMLHHRTCRGSETKEITSFLLAFFAKRLRFKPILIRRSCHLRRAVFRAPKVGLLFWPFSLGPPFAKSQKIRDLGVLAKFTVAQLCEHILEPPFVLKCSPILRDRKCYISCGVLRPHK